MVGANLARYSWLAGSTGWRNSTTYAGWNIRQGAGATLFGIGVDLDDATDDYGGFRLDAPTV
jgi:hypothetical protein